MSPPRAPISTSNKDGKTVTVNVEREVRLRVPIHTLGGIVCFGNIMMSPFLMGFLHRDRPGRRSLALDIMEEFRPFLADRLALSLINLG